MNVITEPARQTPVIHKTDVLVVGSGPGGLRRRLLRRARGLMFVWLNDLAALAEISPLWASRALRGIAMRQPSKPVVLGANLKIVPVTWVRLSPKASR